MLLCCSGAVAVVIMWALAGCAPLADYDKLVAALPSPRIVEVDGQRVHVERWGDRGDPVILIHGLGSSTYSFRELGPRLGRSRQVVAIDLNGFGFTERPEAEGAYALDGQLDLVVGTMDALGIRRADVVGHSYGGYLAMRLAHEHPERARRLVLVSPALNMDVAPDSFIRSPVLRQMVYPGFRLLVSDRDRFGQLLSRAYHRQDLLTDELVGEYQRRILVEGLGRAYRGFGSSLDSLQKDRVELSDLRQKVLVVAGRHDRVVPVESIEIALRDQPDHVRFEVLEHSGHSAPEEQPDLLGRRIERFFGGG